SLLVAQQNAAATLAQAQADKEAQQAAASEQLRNGDNISTSSSKSWSFQ
ncbi:TPA: P-type conjugative transfer protein TrbJ, partial [Salmonella enterica]